MVCPEEEQQKYGDNFSVCSFILFMELIVRGYLPGIFHFCVEDKKFQDCLLHFE